MSIWSKAQQPSSAQLEKKCSFNLVIKLSIKDVRISSFSRCNFSFYIKLNLLTWIQFLLKFLMLWLNFYIYIKLFWHNTIFPHRLICKRCFHRSITSPKPGKTLGLIIFQFPCPHPTIKVRDRFNVHTEIVKNLDFVKCLILDRHQNAFTHPVLLLITTIHNNLSFK